MSSGKRAQLLSKERLLATLDVSGMKRPVSLSTDPALQQRGQQAAVPYSPVARLPSGMEIRRSKPPCGFAVESNLGPGRERRWAGRFPPLSLAAVSLGGAGLVAYTTYGAYTAGIAAGNITVSDVSHGQQESTRAAAWQAKAATSLAKAGSIEPWLALD